MRKRLLKQVEFENGTFTVTTKGWFGALMSTIEGRWLLLSFHDKEDNTYEINLAFWIALIGGIWFW